jgi:hypothetical protein
MEGKFTLQTKVDMIYFLGSSTGRKSQSLLAREATQGPQLWWCLSLALSPPTSTPTSIKLIVPLLFTAPFYLIWKIHSILWWKRHRTWGPCMSVSFDLSSGSPAWGWAGYKHSEEAQGLSSQCAHFSLSLDFCALWLIFPTCLCFIVCRVGPPGFCRAKVL